MTTTAKLTTGAYDAAENILHLWFPQSVELTDEETVRASFDEVIEDWIKPCPRPPFLLVNFGNLHIRPNMAPVYSKNIARFQSMLRGTYRYGMPASFTGVAVALGNLELKCALPHLCRRASRARSDPRGEGAGGCGPRSRSGVARPAPLIPAARRTTLSCDRRARCADRCKCRGDRAGARVAVDHRTNALAPRSEGALPRAARRPSGGEGELEGRGAAKLPPRMRLS